MAKNVIYKTVDLFGNETINFIEKKKTTTKTLFDDYEAFVDKFEGKKTTDDCYTPDNVYKAVLNFISGKIELNGLQIIRPFYPDGDFESIEYKNNCIVIDNPPFSIVSKIARFYIENGVRFFLFAPHMTLFSSNLKCTAVVVGGDIIYENKATVKTSFLSNIFGDIRILAAPELYNDLNIININSKVSLPKYDYPENVITVSKVQKFVENGIDFKVKYSECSHCSQLDSQKKHKKTLFGSGFLLSEKAAAEKAAAEKAAAEKAAAEKAAAEKAAA
ncbi:MAG: chromosome partitioning protein ParB, partial [Bacteroidota bacterium]